MSTRKTKEEKEILIADYKDSGLSLGKLPSNYIFNGSQLP